LKYITAAGDADTEVVNSLIAIANQFEPIDNSHSYKSTNTPNSEKITKKNSAQTTLRLGRKLFNRPHPDFRKLQVLNTIIGGYFGSRLMKNIREDKGLTYGIYSVFESYLDDGCFYIEADVNSQKVDLAISEINKELEYVNNNLIGEKELATAKNYFLGSLLRGIDGPFSTMDRNRIIIDYGFDTNYYEEFLDIIKSTSAKELQDLSNIYFTPQNLVAIVCGG
jgi:zinc protease